MGSELARMEPNGVLEQARWANQLAAADMLPGAYKGRPGNLIMAAELARSLNLHPMTAITGMYVINGKPSASGALMAALVRRAGHKLRVRGNNLKATAVLIRKDDPDFEFEVTWELMKNAAGNPSAEEAGLLGKDTWRNFPAALLKWRAVSQVCRDGAEDALMGVHYTPEELGAVVNQDGIPIRVEQMERVSPEEMLATMIGEATTESTLVELHRMGATAGILNEVPPGASVPVLALLNARMRELKEAAAAREQAAAAGREEPAQQAQGVDLGAAVTDDSEDTEEVDAEIVSIYENEVL